MATDVFSLCMARKRAIVTWFLACPSACQSACQICSPFLLEDHTIRAISTFSRLCYLATGAAESALVRSTLRKETFAANEATSHMCLSCRSHDRQKKLLTIEHVRLHNLGRGTSQFIKTVAKHHNTKVGRAWPIPSANTQTCV